MFVRYDRALGAFKDPNVYGPFLILPLLFLIERMLSKRIDFLSLVSTGIIMFGLLLGFSRGAWFHFGVSAAIVIGLVFLTAPTPKARMRVFAITMSGVAALAVLLVILLSIDSIGNMFKERAQLIQYYDVGQGGRFRLQELALGSVLDFPNGMGPFEFARVHGLQQHNVYLQAFLVYGWAGAMSYFMLLISTVWIGFRTALMRSPWQGYSICALRSLRRRNGRRFYYRHRPLAPFLSDPGDHLGSGRGQPDGKTGAAFFNGARLSSKPRSTSCRAGSAGAGRRPAYATISQSLKPAARQTLNR